MSIASEITRLQGAKADIKTAIEVKGVTIPSNATLDEYSDYVEEISTGITPTGTINITENGTSDVTNYASANVNVQPDLETKSITITENTTITITPTQGKDGLSSVQVTTNVSGGGETPTNLEPINDLLQEHYNYLLSVPNNYSAILGTPATLYTPNADYKTYVISKSSYGTYGIYWIPTNTLICLNSSSGKGDWGKYSIVYNSSGELKYGNAMVQVYRATGYNSFSSALTAIQSNTTSYSTSSNNGFPAYDNAPYFVTASNTAIVRNGEDTPSPSQKISSNETIEVIS